LSGNELLPLAIEIIFRIARTFATPVKRDHGVSAFLLVQCTKDDDAIFGLPFPLGRGLKRRNVERV